MKELSFLKKWWGDFAPKYGEALTWIIAAAVIFGLYQGAHYLIVTYTNISPQWVPIVSILGVGIFVLVLVAIVLAYLFCALMAAILSCFSKK